MRGFLTFLSMFTLLFFLAPVLCLSAPAKQDKTGGETVTVPESVSCNGSEISTADLLVGRLAAWDLRGYQPEALKAAAVAAATELCAVYAKTGTGDGLAVMTAKEAKEAWGDYWFSVYWPEFQQAVSDTWGQTLSGAGAAPVFPVSWGCTASGVVCPYDFTANEYETELSVSLESFEEAFPACKTSLTVKKAQSNRVETVTSGTTVRSGTEVAARFGLPSPCFSVTVEEDRVTFLCFGQGDGEGMSLYGANELAKRGAGYKEILKTFYPEATVNQDSNRS